MLQGKEWAYKKNHILENGARHTEYSVCYPYMFKSKATFYNISVTMTYIMAVTCGGNL